MADFKSGARKSAVQARDPMRLKEQLAKAITDAELEAAATYFASIKPRSIVRVVESATAPQAVVTAWYYSAVPGGEQEPIGQRIVEVPENARAIRQPRHPRALCRLRARRQHQARSGAGDDRRRAGRCHAAPVTAGPACKGVSAIGIPGIAGRSPSYLVRQLYDFKHGTRTGGQSVLMKSSVDKIHHRRHDRARRLCRLAGALTYCGGSRPLALSTAAAAGDVRNCSSASTASPCCVVEDTPAENGMIICSSAGSGVGTTPSTA